MALTVRIIAPKDISDAERTAWLSLRCANAALYSPYFHPDYTKMIGELRDDAYVAIAEQCGEPVAFFPYQGSRPGKSGFARPIGAPMTDYHGVIAAQETELDYETFFRQTEIGAYHYSALVDPADSLTKHPYTSDIATVMNISNGAEAWRSKHDSSYRRHLKSTRRRIRKAEEDIGPRRFEFNCRRQNVFDTLICWKTQQFQDTGKYNVLSADWTLELLYRLWTSDGDLRCDMQVMYFGDRIAAIDLGLTDGHTFHSWIVAYDGDLHSYAPGIQLLEALIDEGEKLGYSRIDLGVGTDGYKRHYATEDISVKKGFIPVKGPAAALSKAYETTECLGRKMLGDAPGKLRRRYSQIAACDDTLSGRAKALFGAFKTSATQ